MTERFKIQVRFLSMFKLYTVSTLTRQSYIIKHGPLLKWITQVLWNVWETVYIFLSKNSVKNIYTAFLNYRFTRFTISPDNIM